MKINLVYNSKTGFTKKYADWIAEEINCPVQPYKDFMATSPDADIILFGSRVHGGKIEYLNKMKTFLKGMPTKQLIVFATGATPAAAENVIKKIWADNFTEDESKAIPHFYMQSGLNYEKMGFMDRSILKMVSKMLSGKKDKTEEEAGFEQAIREAHDHSSKEYIEPLVEWVKNIQSKTR